MVDFHVKGFMNIFLCTYIFWFAVFFSDLLYFHIFIIRKWKKGLLNFLKNITCMSIYLIIIINKNLCLRSKTVSFFLCFLVANSSSLFRVRKGQPRQWKRLLWTKSCSVHHSIQVWGCLTKKKKRKKERSKRREKHAIYFPIVHTRKVTPEFSARQKPHPWADLMIIHTALSIYLC